MAKMRRSSEIETKGENKMNKLMMVVALCAAAAVLPAAEVLRTEGEKKLPPPQLAGFAIGETIDVHDKEALAARNLSCCGETRLAQVGYTYYECESKKAIGEFKSVFVDVSTNKQVIGVCVVLPCKDKEESERKAAEMREKIKAEFASRLADPGTYDLSVTPADNSVDIEYRTTAFKAIVDRNTALASGAK